LNVAIIPARGGSKRIHRKNIRLFFGKPMIFYAISAAMKTGLFDSVIVSTDDEEISKIAISLGAEVPFTRPLELSDDHTPTIPVIQHAINKLIEMNRKLDYVCCIYPSVPLIESKDIVNAFNAMIKENSSSCYPVSEFASAPQRALKRDISGRVEYFYPQYRLTRTQDLEAAFYDAGQFYWGKTSAWLNDTFYDAVTITLPKWQVIDIDTLHDWRRAELYYQSLKGLI